MENKSTLEVLARKYTGAILKMIELGNNHFVHIQKTLELPPVPLTRVLKETTKAGLVERVVGERNSRDNFITYKLTPKGRKAIKLIEQLEALD